MTDYVANPIATLGHLTGVVERRLLLGPGPQNAHPRVHHAMAIPQVGIGMLPVDGDTCNVFRCI